MGQQNLAHYFAVRHHAAWIDRTERTGIVAVTGSERFSWLQAMVSNDVRLLEKGYPRILACVLTPTGHVLTDLAILSLDESALLELPPCLLLDMPRENVEKTLTYLDHRIIVEDVQLHDITEQVACLSLQGPKAQQLLPTLSFPAVIAPADHTGSGGFDIYVAAQWRNKVSQSVDVPLLDKTIAELLRIEAGIPKYGAELDENVIALEANLRKTHISLTKGCYVGQEIMARIESRGHTNRGLIGFVFPSKQIPEPGETIYPPQEPARIVGRITSVAECSPIMEGLPIALGFVRHEFAKPHTILHVGPAGKEAFVTPLPFYTPERGIPA